MPIVLPTYLNSSIIRQILILLSTTKATMLTNLILATSLLIVSVVLYVLYNFVIKIYLDANRFKKMDPETKIFVSPFFGLLGLQKKCLQKYGDSLQYVKDMMKENPNQKAYATNIGHRSMIILCDAQLIKELMLNPKKFRKFNLYKHNQLTYKRGLFLAEDQEWTRQKTIVRHSFNHQNIKKMIPQMKNSISKFINKMDDTIQKSQTKSVDFKVLHDAETLIGEILVRIFFSEEAIEKKLRDKDFSIVLAESTVQMFHRSRSPFNLFCSFFFGQKVAQMNFNQEDRQYEKLVYEIRDVISSILQGRLGKISAQEQIDFIQVYINQMRENDRLIKEAQAENRPHKISRITIEEIIHQLISFYFAGIDTTGHLVAYSLYCIAQYPDCKKKLCQQIQKVIGNKQGLTYQNIQKLDYMSNFIDQVLRMWPPATGTLARVARQDFKIGPYEIPQGTIVGTNILGLTHNPRYYTNPEQFRPERWVESNVLKTQPYSFVVFSAGPRSCIGKYLALLQAKIILISFLSSYQFQRTEVPLRNSVKFLYQPLEDNLVRLKKGGIQLA